MSTRIPIDLIHIIGTYLEPKIHIRFSCFDEAWTDYTSQILCIKVLSEKITTVYELSLIIYYKKTITDFIDGNKPYIQFQNNINDAYGTLTYKLHSQGADLIINDYGDCNDDYSWFEMKLRDKRLPISYQSTIIKLSKSEKDEFLSTLKCISGKIDQ